MNLTKSKILVDEISNAFKGYNVSNTFQDTYRSNAINIDYTNDVFVEYADGDKRKAMFEILFRAKVSRESAFIDERDLYLEDIEKRINTVSNINYTLDDKAITIINVNYDHVFAQNDKEIIIYLQCEINYIIERLEEDIEFIIRDSKIN